MDYAAIASVLFLLGTGGVISVLLRRKPHRSCTCHGTQIYEAPLDLNRHLWTTPLLQDSCLLAARWSWRGSLWRLFYRVKGDSKTTSLRRSGTTGLVTNQVSLAVLSSIPIHGNGVDMATPLTLTQSELTPLRGSDLSAWRTSLQTQAGPIAGEDSDD